MRMVNYLAGTTVLVGIDFSEHSERALQRAVALAEANGAQIELVHVFEWPDELAPTAGEAPLRTDRANSGLWNAAMTLAQASRSRLGRLCSTIVGDRATAGIRVVLDEPARGLLQAAQQVSAPLIVLGAHGRGSLPRHLVGATAQQVCANSQVPVLLVPGPAPTRVVDVELPVTPGHSLVCSCSRCGSAQRSRSPLDLCSSCGSPPDIWVSVAQPQTLLA